MMRYILLTLTLLVTLPLIGDAPKQTIQDTGESPYIQGYILKNNPHTGELQLQIAVGKSHQQIRVRLPLAKRHLFRGKRKTRYVFFTELKPGAVLNFISPELHRDILRNRVKKDHLYPVIQSNVSQR